MGRRKKQETEEEIKDQEQVVFRVKNNKQYVSNKDLLREIIISKEQDQLTNNAIKMFQLMAENLAKTKPYKYPEDKEDCIQSAMLDIA